MQITCLLKQIQEVIKKILEISIRLSKYDYFYGKQNIDSKDINSVIKSLKRDYLTQGPLVKEFENKL